jgi:imidazolonepropionase-like amidohydrolase
MVKVFNTNGAKNMADPNYGGHKETLEGRAESVGRILKAGGRLGMGGDYGFAWNPHGAYAKELTFFVKYVGLSPPEVLTCATKTGAEIMGRGHEFGTLEAGKLADVLVVDGDVLADISILQDRSRFLAVMQGGVIKAGRWAGRETVGGDPTGPGAVG